MKRILLSEYKNKKIIADNLENLTDKKYIEISDEEYSRIQNAINNYIGNNQEEISYIAPPSKGLSIIERLNQLEADIKSLKQDIFYVEEDGLYFTDDNGNVAASLDTTGFHTIGEARDLSITDY